MIAALMIGKHKSGGVPGKNYMSVLGRPMVEYGLMAAGFSKKIDKLFVSTDSPEILEAAEKYDATIIERPAYLAQSESPTEDVYVHGYNAIREMGYTPEYLVLMFANAPCVQSHDLEKGIQMLQDNTDLDSVVSIAKFNMFSPMRARKLNPDGTSEPTIPLDELGLENTFHRDAQGDIYYVDFGVQVVRPERCLTNSDNAAMPFLWLGNKQGSFEVPGGFDVDAPWQVCAVEHWLRERGFSPDITPYESET